MMNGPNIKHLPVFMAKMRQAGLPKVVIDTFAYYYEQVVSGATGMIPEPTIRPVDKSEIADAATLDSYISAGKDALKQTVQIVLNGGLGTSMGLTGPKNLLKGKDDKTFLQSIIEQAAASGVRLVFMNSFATDAQTRAAINMLAPQTPPRFFLQHKFPKILREGFHPAHWPENPDLEWNPPGHGEIYTALSTSGLLSDLLDEGVRYALVVNGDNLGATLEPALLGYFSTHRFSFMMEVARRTSMDMKGGHLARNTNDRLILREIAQCPEEDLAAFQDIEKYRYFNVNSLWINLQALNTLVRRNPVIRLPMILNPKSLDPRNADSPPVFQVETAMGAAISLFDGATAVEVLPTRFLPVKKCADLLALRSDCFIFQADGSLMPNPARRLGRIQVNLDPAFYTKIDDFEKRFAHGVPSLIDCETLTVKGDVYFESAVVIKGKVLIHNNGPEATVISAGTVIDKNQSF